jgi:hypothetical protein
MDAREFKILIVLVPFTIGVWSLALWLILLEFR